MLLHHVAKGPANTWPAFSLCGLEVKHPSFLPSVFACKRCQLLLQQSRNELADEVNSLHAMRSQIEHQADQNGHARGYEDGYQAGLRAQIEEIEHGEKEEGPQDEHTHEH